MSEWKNKVRTLAQTRADQEALHLVTGGGADMGRNLAHRTLRIGAGDSTPAFRATPEGPFDTDAENYAITLRENIFDGGFESVIRARARIRLVAAHDRRPLFLTHRACA